MVQTVPKTVWRFLVVQKTIEISLLQFIDKVLPYVVAQRQIPTVLRQCRKLRSFRSCNSSWGRGGCLLARCVQKVPGFAVLDKVDMPVVATTGAFGFFVQKTVEVPQLQAWAMFAGAVHPRLWTSL